MITGVKGGKLMKLSEMRVSTRGKVKDLGKEDI